VKALAVPGIEPFGPHESPDFRPYRWPDIAPEKQALERLEAEITELWGHLNAATYRFLKLVAEFDKRRGWALHGLANCAQWLNWQCGIGAVAAREKVRVANALEGLPKIADSFRRGVISYSKVRAMTRIAAPENEAELLNIAESGTAAHVERVVAKYRRVERIEDARRAHGLHRHRSVHFFYDEDGSLVIHAKLPPDVGAVVKKAIEAALAMLEDEEGASSAESGKGETAGTDGAIRGSAAQGAAASAGNASVETFSNEAAYEHELGREPPRQDTLAARRADALQLLADSFLTRQSDELGSVADRFQVVVHVEQRALAAGARASGARADDTRSEDRNKPADWARCELEDELGNERALALETARRLGCDCSLVGMLEGDEGELLSVGRKTRSIPPALARALKARDGGCRFPGCTHTRSTEGHHVKHWADGGKTKLGNLLTLCGFHHHLVHEGGFGVHVLDDGAERDAFVFTRPDGTRIEANGRNCFRGNNFAGTSAGSSIGAGAGGAGVDQRHAPAVFAVNRAAGLAIDWRTARCGWHGERIDYGLAIEALIQRRDRARAGNGATSVGPDPLAFPPAQRLLLEEPR
jgi:hypothetical protein